MRRLGEIMEEMGFNKNASEETQKAFIRHLIKAAQIPNSEIQPKVEKKSEQYEQLSFNLDEAS